MILTLDYKCRLCGNRFSSNTTLDNTEHVTSGLIASSWPALLYSDCLEHKLGPAVADLVAFRSEPEEEPLKKFDPATRDRRADLMKIADFVRQHLYSWAMPADLGITFGFVDGKEWETCATSVEELFVWMEWDYRFDQEDPEVRRYLRELWTSVGEFIREQCEFMLKEQPDVGRGTARRHASRRR